MKNRRGGTNMPPCSRCRCKAEVVNGDAWAIYTLPERTIYLMLDGLGHGPFAFEAASVGLRMADAALQQDLRLPLSAIIQRMHPPMQATRGAAVMLVSVSFPGIGPYAQVLCCGVGNVSAMLCGRDGTMRAMISHNGTVGHRMARVQEFVYPALPGATLVMHTDGVSTRWKLAQYPDVLLHTPATLAGLTIATRLAGGTMRRCWWHRSKIHG